MNVLTYEVKRAHWRGTWHAIRAFRRRADEIGVPELRHMTPARFDILYVAWRADWQIHEKRRELGMPPLERRIALWELRELLGLARPTISRTAHRLDELEFVRVVRDEGDARYAVVLLTELGERMLRLAVECIRQDRVGMSDCIVKHVSDGAFERLCDAGPAERIELDDRLGVLVDRARSYAQFFGCQAVPIYDTRVVMYLRPRTVSLLTWAIRGPDPRSEIMHMNHVLIDAARRDATHTRGESLPTQTGLHARVHQQPRPQTEKAQAEPTKTQAQGEQGRTGQPGKAQAEPTKTQAQGEHGRTGQPGKAQTEPTTTQTEPTLPWRLEDLPADYFWTPSASPKVMTVLGPPTRGDDLPEREPDDGT